jgi:hypothetical protein
MTGGADAEPTFETFHHCGSSQRASLEKEGIWEAGERRTDCRRTLRRRFSKGCYVGQEVVSRMKHRGGARKRVVRVRLDGAVPARGTPVVDGELPVGMLGASAGASALAMLRLDRVEEARAAR